MSDVLRELVSQNPMLIEVRRFWRKFFSVSPSAAVNRVAGGLFAVVYTMVLIVTFTYREYISPEAIVQLQTVLFCVIVPSMMHSSIAGEREKRTWDMLMVAPISHTQVIVGKFLGGMVGVGAVAGAMTLPILMTYLYSHDYSLRLVIGAECLSLGYAVFLASLAILISARSSRSFAAHGALYAVQAVVLFLTPMLIHVLFGGSSGTGVIANAFHPFVAVAQLNDLSTVLYTNGRVPVSTTVSEVVGPLWGPPQLLIACILAAIFLRMAVTSVRRYEAPA